MATKIAAINYYRPRVVQGRNVEINELVGYLSGRTGLNEGEIRYVVTEMRDALTYFSTQGRGLRLEGLGIWRADIALTGEFRVLYRADRWLINALNAPRRFQGEIANRQYIGFSSAALVELWNTEHPEDPVSDAASAALSKDAVAVHG